MKKTILLFFLLSSSIINAQDFFNNYILDLTDQVTKTAKFSSVKKLLLKNDFQLKEVEDNSSGGKTYYFKSSDFSIGIMYYTDDRIIVVVISISPQQFYKLENVLETKNFEIIATEKQKNDNNVLVEINKWAKSNYPYHIITDHTNHSITFNTSISKNY